jgi:hypothetical protein
MKFPKILPAHRAILISALKNRVIILILIGFLALLLIWMMPQAAAATFWQEDQIGTPLTGDVLPTDPALSVAVSSNSEQTIGVIIGGIILVLVVVGGTLGVIRRKD